MKKGKIYCQDTIPRLKHKYGKGFTVLLKLKSKTQVENAEETATDSNTEHSTLLADSKEVEAVKHCMQHTYTCILQDEHAVSKNTIGFKIVICNIFFVRVCCIIM